MQTDHLVIRVQPPGSVWEAIGVDRYAGVTPENVTASANEWGSDTASFDLRRNPGAIYPDLQAFTPAEIEVAGETVWSGRTLEAPAHDGADPVLNVQLQGAQYELDDDTRARYFVHTNVNEWRDARSYPDATLANWTAAPTVTTDNGAVLIQWPKSQVIINSTFAGVILDLGPYSTAASISVDWDSSNNAAVAGLYLRCAASAQNIVAGPNSDAVANILNTTGASGTSRGTFAVPGRYVGIFMFNGNGADFTPAADVYFRLKAIRVFASDAYRSTDASILHASDVVKDVGVAGRLSTDTSQVAATTFVLPDLHFGTTPQAPRETIQAVNALHNYITKVDVDRRPVFQPRPTAPLYEIGAWGGADFEDASANSGQDVYNRALITGTGPDGTSLIIDRAGYAGWGDASLTRYGGWAISPSSSDPFAEVAGYIDTQLLTSGPTQYADAVPYRVTMAFTWTGSGGAPYWVVRLGEAPSGVFVPGNYVEAVLTSPQTFTLQWTPTHRTKDVRLYFYLLGGNVAAGHGWTSVSVQRSNGTLADRQGITRTKIIPVNAALTAALGNQIGDVFLAAHATQPLKGNVTVSPTGVRSIRGGDVHPAHLLRETGQRLRLSHRIDPDTGGQGRDGMIASVTYNHDARQAALALDEDRRNFDVLLSRFAALSPAA